MGFSGKTSLSSIIKSKVPVKVPDHNRPDAGDDSVKYV
jgi:hypothetical protein